MQSTQTPTLVPLAWAANGTKNTIPEASQITITPGAASLNDGFPPICAVKVAAGGIAPAYGDFNGILNLITQSIRWAHAGGRYTWNSTFTTDANVAGYPNGATLMRADLTGFWINTADSNETNPDATDGSAANWVPGYNYGVTPITGLTNANVTLTPAQAAKSKITLAGTLTGNVQIIFPAWTKEWEVVNNTTGAFTLTAKTAAGSGVALAAGQQKITGDGTNITQPAESIAPATASQHAVQFGQMSGVVGFVRNLKMSVTAPSASASLTADEIIVETALGGLRYCLASFNKTINLATIGAGGMDAGSAPASGYVALYAIYNPTLQTSALLATNASAGVQPNVYGGANMPAGYTASALVSVWQTNGSSQFIIGTQRDRKIWIAPTNIVNTASIVGVWTSQAFSAAPANAIKCSGYFLVNAASGTGTLTISLASSSSAIGQKSISAYVSGANASIGSFDDVPISTPQTLYYQTASNGTATSLSFVVAVCSYEI